MSNEKTTGSKTRLGPDQAKTYIDTYRKNGFSNKQILNFLNKSYLTARGKRWNARTLAYAAGDWKDSSRSRATTEGTEFELIKEVVLSNLPANIKKTILKMHVLQGFN